MVWPMIPRMCLKNIHVNYVPEATIKEFLEILVL